VHDTKALHPLSSSIGLSSELGFRTTRVRQIGRFGATQNIKESVYDRLRPSNCIRGGCHDVMSVAWGSDGNFAIGTAATQDRYNRPGNLIMGNINSQEATQLNGHRVERPYSVRSSDDDAVWRYSTVSKVVFSPDGQYMYSSALQDGNALVWNASKSEDFGSLKATLHHKSEVDVLGVTPRHPSLLATGSKTNGKQVRVFDMKQNTGQSFMELGGIRPDDHPTCLAWGIHGSVSNLLLAGFTNDDGEDRNTVIGDLQLWDVETGDPLTIPKGETQFGAFDCIWHPTYNHFATATKASARKNSTTKSSIRTFEVQGSSVKRRFNLDCPAFDVNELSWA
jgi:WD40 repeat protein